MFFTFSNAIIFLSESFPNFDESIRKKHSSELSMIIFLCIYGDKSKLVIPFLIDIPVLDKKPFLYSFL